MIPPTIGEELRQPVLFVGARSHAKICRRIIDGKRNFVGVPYWAFPLVYDEDSTVGCPWSGCCIIDQWQPMLAHAEALGIKHFVVAMGNERRGKRRCEIAEHLVELGFEAVKVISPRAIIGTDVKSDEGLQVLAGAIIGDEVKIGRWCLIGSGAIVEHESILEDGVTVMTGAIVNGGVTIKKHASVCAGAIIFPGVTIGEGAIVGAGAVVTKDVEDDFVVVGAPARPTWKSLSILRETVERPHA